MGWSRKEYAGLKNKFWREMELGSNSWLRHLIFVRIWATDVTSLRLGSPLVRWRQASFSISESCVRMS